MPSYSSSIACYEVAGSPSENYDDPRGVMKASVQLQCAWSDRHALVRDICGNRLDWPHSTGGPVPKAATASIAPMLTPDSPAADGQSIKYGQALVTINYTTEIVDLITEAIEPTAEFITLDYRRFRWGANDGPVLTEDEAPGLLVRGINFVRTELQVQLPIPDAVFDLVGYVNSDPYSGSVIEKTFAAETLLYAPPSINVGFNSSGQHSAQVTKKFTYKPQGWNKFFRPLTNSWVDIYVAGGAIFKSYTPTVFTGQL